MHRSGTNGNREPRGNFLTQVHLERMAVKPVCVCVCETGDGHNHVVYSCI